MRETTSEARTLLHTTDNTGDHLRRVQQGLRSEVSVTLGHASLGVPKKALDHVKRDTLVHQEAGERVAQVMETDVSQARAASDAVPWIEQTDELRCEDVRSRQVSWYGSQKDGSGSAPRQRPA